eukprot:TRINITY_DN11833_c0_g1_i1.p3 TRINITY_DN11833_c0_g1~~TRINITY_DN11833_c0_g1_i1.p3  ORF type:complete len:204 (-),score=41.52 TRINITY_DN11833_c0_g1_i1:485-1096(-)
MSDDEEEDREIFAQTLIEPKKLQFLEADEPSPLRAGEMLVRMSYSSVQPLDSEIFKGESKTSKNFPWVLGIEGVGTVMKTRAEKFPVGQQIVFMLRRYGEDFGCWQTEVVLSEKRACIGKLPLTLVPQEAAANISSTFAAIASLRHFGPEVGCPPGAVLIVTGACGAVGLQAMQMAATRLAWSAAASGRAGSSGSWVRCILAA